MKGYNLVITQHGHTWSLITVQHGPKYYSVLLSHHNLDTMLFITAQHGLTLCWCKGYYTIIAKHNMDWPNVMTWIKHWQQTYSVTPIHQVVTKDKLILPVVDTELTKHMGRHRYMDVIEIGCKSIV